MQKNLALFFIGVITLIALIRVDDYPLVKLWQALVLIAVIIVLYYYLKLSKRK